MGGGGEGEGEEVKYKPMKAGEYVLERLRATRALEKEEEEKEKEKENRLKPPERCQLLSREILPTEAR